MTPALEVLHRNAIGPAKGPPLLFVHGGCFGAWCWNEHFLDYFAASGFTCFALSFRAHGASSSDRPLRLLSLEDYVDDVRRTAAALDQPPVLIGHSLGGTVVQRAATRLQVPAQVLLASNPPSGSRSTALRTFRRHPLAAARAAVTGQQLHLFGTTALTRRLFFTEDTPESIIDRTVGKLQNESTVAVAQCFASQRLRPSTPRIQTLVIGGERDAMIRPEQIQATAQFYGTCAHLIPEIGHCIMLDSQWEQAAALTTKWLRGLDCG